MGAWGIGPFENDDALDWVLELEGSGDISLLSSAFEAVNTAQYREAPDCTIALAAAETVAAMRGKPIESLPQEIATWVEQHKSHLTEDLTQAAIEAADHVLVSSELQELWEETEDYATWQNTVRDLIARLR